MRYFTNNPMERMMMKTPKGEKDTELPIAPEGHLCYGCERYGMGCVHPCHREIKNRGVTV